MSSPKGMYRRQGHHRAPSSVSQVTLKTCLLTLGPCKLAIVPVANGSAAQVLVAAHAVPIPRRPVAVARCEALVVATDAVATFVPVFVATLPASPVVLLRGRHAGLTDEPI